jgi:hypothetical protein
VREFDNLAGQTFGIWKVLEFDRMEWYGSNGKHGISYYRCECQKCGKMFSRSRPHLLQHKNIRHRGKCEEV